MSVSEEQPMSDAFEAPKVDSSLAEPSSSEEESDEGGKKLAIFPPPAHLSRDTRPVTNLGKVFGQFADLQHQIAEQVIALEDSVNHQKQEVAAAIAELPELRNRLDWLVSTFYEQTKKDETLRDRVSRQAAAIESLTETVRALQERHTQWETAFDDVIASLVRAKSAVAGR
jgi:hypothetical protein